MDSVKSRAIDWLWGNRFAAGRLSLLVGVPGCGKSFLTCDMAARVTTGSDWPDGQPCRRGSVVLLTAEDDAGDTIRPRLEAHGADLSRVTQLAGVLRQGADEEELISLSDVDVIEKALQQVGDVRMLVIDPIGSFMGSRVDAHRDNEVRAVLAPIGRLAERHNVAAICIAHRRKGSGGSADELALGSRAFTGIARTVWHLSRDPENDERRLLLCGKNNLAREAHGLAFMIEEDRGCLRWEEDPVILSADQGLHREQSAASGGASAAREEAAHWLRENLDEFGREARDVKEAAKADGIKTRTLERAAADLGVIKEKQGFGGGRWAWRLPGGDGAQLHSRHCSLRENGGENGENGTSVARTCDCGEAMIAADEVNGWVNWDCPRCGSVRPSKVAVDRLVEASRYGGVRHG